VEPPARIDIGPCSHLRSHRLRKVWGHYSQRNFSDHDYRHRRFDDAFGDLQPNCSINRISTPVVAFRNITNEEPSSEK